METKENNKNEDFNQSSNNVSDPLIRPSVSRNNLSVTSIGQTFRNSIRRISDYYSANNKILARGVKKGESGIDNDAISQSENQEDSQMSVNIVENEKQEFSKNFSNELKDSTEDTPEDKKLSFWATLFTFIKLNIVAGFLFLPAGFKSGGWLFSMIGMVGIMFLNVYSMICICESSDKLKTFSLSKIGLKSLKKFGFYVCEFGIAFTQVCFPCSYINLTTQIFNNLINIWVSSDKNYYILIGISLAIILIPLCLVRNIQKFSVFHLIGDLSLIATLVALTYESIKTFSNNTDFDFNKLKLFNSDWAKLLGMGIASSEGIGLILPIKEKSNVSKTQFNLIIIIGSSIISIILVGFPFLMYVCYQDSVNEIILNNLDLKANLYIQIILLFLIFSILIVYPVVLYPSFKIINSYLLKNVESKDAKFWWDTLIRIVIVIGTITVGILSIGNFDTLLALVGSGICCPISLIFPTLFHYKIFKDEQSRLRNGFDIFISLMGIGISLTVLIFTFVK